MITCISILFINFILKNTFVHSIYMMTLVYLQHIRKRYATKLNFVIPKTPWKYKIVKLYCTINVWVYMNNK